MKATVLKMDPRAISVSFTEGSPPAMTVGLADGRSITVPLAWSPRLVRATAEERLRYEILAEGCLLHWPAVDEDIWVPGLLATDEIVVPPDGDLRLSTQSPGVPPS